MSSGWYYVQGSERVGPVEQSEIQSLIQGGTLNSESYIWKKGFQNWEHLKNVEDFNTSGGTEAEEVSFADDEPAFSVDSDESFSIEEDQNEQEVEKDEVIEPSNFDKKEIDWASMPESKQCVLIKVGFDRGGDDVEYGPFSIEQLTQAFKENRISEKTYIFVAGMENWKLLGDTPAWARVSGTELSMIADDDRRIDPRKPFVAKMLFHDNSEVYEGICRDISIGGLQILISNYPGAIGDGVTLNVHPENTENSFVAKGKIVRLLEGNTGFSMRFEELGDSALDAINSYLRNV